MHPLNQTVYCVYEAKKYAERVSSVGKATFLVVVRPNGSSTMLAAKGRLYLDEQFAKYGPHAFGDQPIALEPDHFAKPIGHEEAR